MAKDTCEVWPHSINVLKKSENAKDEEGSQAKNEAVDKTKNKFSVLSMTHVHKPGTCTKS